MRKLIWLLALAVAAAGCVTVDEGEAVVPVRFGEAKAPITESGIHFFNFITHDAVSFPTRPVEITFSNDEKTLPAIQALSSEGASVGIDATFLVSIQPEAAETIYGEVGQSWEAVLANIAVPTFRSKVRDCIPQFEFESARTSNRGEAQACIMESVQETLGKRGIIVSEVLLRDMRADASLQSAIDQKLQAQNAVKEAEFNQQRQAVENQTNIDRVEAEREARVIEAQGIAEANRVIAESLTPELLQLRIVQELGNNTVYFFGDGGGAQPRIDIPVGQ